MNNLKISIIIPVYNAEKCLKRCLESVIAQTYKNIEIICIDDGSTDTSINILNEFKKTDDRFIIQTQINSGQGAVRNIGITMASGDYVIFLDADDYLELNACEILSKRIENNKIDVLFFDYNKCFDDIKIPLNRYNSFDSNFKNKIITLNEIFNNIAELSRESWYKIYKKSFLIANKISFANTRGGSEDTPFWIKLVTLNPNCMIVDDILYNYVIDDNAISSSSLTSSSIHYKDIFKTFEISNEIIIHATIENDLKYKLLNANFKWYQYRYNNSDKKAQEKITKLKNSLFKKYALYFKKEKDLRFLFPLVQQYYNNKLEKIISVKNNNKHKVLTILGVKFKFKRKNKDIKKNKELCLNAYKIKPIEIINDNAIPICFASNNNFTEYLYICIFSLIKNADNNNFYDIVILEKDINDSNKQLLKTLQNEYVSIRFYNLKLIIENLNLSFTINLHFALENYFRLFIPLIFKNYNKVLYVDSDGIFCDDISKIYKTQLEGNMIGAVKDYIVLNQIYSLKNIEYYFNLLKLNNPLNYFNSGVMLMDIQKLLEFDFAKKSFNLINNFTPLFVDQCIINKILDGKIKSFPSNYNVNYVFDYLLEQKTNKDNLPLELKQELLNGRNNPIFIHYLTHLKPWKHPNVPMSNIFWDLAKETGMYERILYKNLRLK